MGTQLTYGMFYREHGVRYITHLKNPRLMEYSDLVLPRESIIHWVDYENKYLVGPPENEPLLVQKDNKLYVEAISRYPDENVRPGFILVKSNTRGFVTQYDSDNPNILRMTKMVNEYISNEVTPLYCYGLLNTTYRYKTYIDSALNKWLNYHYTVMQTALEVSKISDRQQFIELDVPSHFPTYQNLKKGEGGVTKANIRYLPSSDHWLIISMWNLIAGNGNDFIFNNYELKDFNKINIIWRIGSRYMLTNMGVLLGFTYGESSSVNVIKLQKMFVSAFITMNSQLAEMDSDKNEADAEVDTFVNEEEANADAEDVNVEDDEYINDDDVVSNPFKRIDVNVVDKMQQAELSDNFIADGIVKLDDDSDQFLNDLNVIADDDNNLSLGYNAYVAKEVTGLTVIEEEGSKLVKAGIMSIGSLERLKRLSLASGQIGDPLNPRLNISESRKISKEDIKIENETTLNVASNDIVDNSMNYSSLNKYNKQYIERVHHKDILNAVMSIEKGGVIIKDYSIEKIETVNDKYNIHKVQIETLRGHVSTLSFKVPIIESDGTFKSAGSRRYIRKQRGDVPIRKISHDSVALTSYYSKMFVNRSDRKQFDVDHYITNHILTSTIDNVWHISDIKFGNVFNGQIKLPRIYTTLARKFISFKCRDYALYFNVNKIDENFSDRLKRKNIIPLGKDINTGKTTLYITNEVVPKLLDGTGTPINSTLEELIGLNIQTLPVEYADVNIFGKNVPLVLMLGHHLGFGNLLKTLKLKPRREARNKKLKLEHGEYVIKFKDEVLIFNKLHSQDANLIVNGLLRLKNTMGTLSVYDLDNKSIYTDLFEEVNAPIKLLKESKDMFNMWMDPITENILTDMGEPTDLVLLFLRSCELLTFDDHPDSMDIGYMRDKGYERISGMIYSELVKATREYNTRSLYNNNKLSINPESVWFSIITDQTVALVEDSNPIHNLKEAEVVIFSGAGGRSGTTMTAPSRTFHKSNLGVISEATVDSGDTGTIIYNVADPNYSSVYGISKRIDNLSEVGGAKLLSPSALLAPGGEHDD